MTATHVHIARDHVSAGDSFDRTGDRFTFRGLEHHDPATLPRVRFDAYDDDGERVYSGTVTHDPDCIVIEALHDWGMADAGCTRLMTATGAGGAMEQVYG